MDSQRHPGSIETAYGWTVVAVSFALIAAGNASYYLSIVALKPIAADLGWPRTVPALGYSLAMIGSGIGGVWMGLWSDRRGITAPVATGVAAIGAGALAIGSVTSAWAFLMIHAVFLGLLGNAAMYGPLVASASRWFDVRRGTAVGIVSAGQAVAGGLWAPVFRASNDAFGWPTTYRAYGALMLLAVLPLTLALRRAPPGWRPSAGASPDARRQTAVLGLPPAAVLAVLCGAIVGCCVAMAMPLVHLVAHASDLGYGLARGAQMLSTALLCALLGRLAWGAISDRIGGLRTMLATSAWQALGLLALALFDGEVALYVVAAFFGLGYGGLVPAYTVFMREVFPVDGIGLRVGLVLLFGTLGMALGGWLGALVQELTESYRGAFLVGFACNLVNLALLAALGARWRRHRPSAARSAAALGAP